MPRKYHHVLEGGGGEYYYCAEQEDLNDKIEFLKYLLNEKDREKWKLDCDKSDVEQKLRNREQELTQATENLAKVNSEKSQLEIENCDLREGKTSKCVECQQQKEQGTTEQTAQLRVTDNEKFPEADHNEEDKLTYKQQYEFSERYCGELQLKITEMKAEIVHLKSENQKEREQKEQFENEKAEFMRKFNDMKDERDRTTEKLEKLTSEIREMKKKYEEVRGEDCSKTEKEVVDDADFEGSDECVFDFEYASFKLQFTELQKKVSYLGQKCFLTRNSKLIGEVTRKIVPTTEISSNVKEEVVAVLKKGSSDLKNALDDLTPLEAEFPTSSSNKKNTDAKLLD